MTWGQPGCVSAGHSMAMGCPFPPHTHPDPSQLAVPPQSLLASSPGKHFTGKNLLSSDFQHFGFNKLLLGYSAAFGVSRTSTLILEGSNRNMVFVVSSSQDRQPCAPGEIGFSVDLGFLLLGVSERESHTSINQLCE